VNNTAYKYINLTNLRENTFGDISIFTEIMEMFLVDIDVFLNLLNSEITKRNWPKLFQGTHKIKPNISMFGIFSLESSILKLENCFRKEEDLQEVDSLSRFVIYSLNEVKKEIQIELKQLRHE
jgi:HPt (histidine-containing phosphotransfer) domain-containing protein